MLMIDELEIAGPGAGAHSSNGRSPLRRILVPVRSPGESGSALAVAARICTLASGVLCLVHVRTCDPPLRSAARFYRETPAQAAAVLEEALRRPAGHHGRRGCPGRACGLGDRMAGDRMVRRPDRADPLAPVGAHPPGRGQRPRSGHAQSELLPGTRHPSPPRRQRAPLHLIACTRSRPAVFYPRCAVILGDIWPPDKRAGRTPELTDLCPAWRCHPNGEGRACSALGGRVFPGSPRARCSACSSRLRNSRGPWGRVFLRCQGSHRGLVSRERFVRSPRGSEPESIPTRVEEVA